MQINILTTLNHGHKKKNDVNRMNTILFTIVEQIKNISILLCPIIPISANKILDILNIKEDDRTIENINKLDILDTDLELKKAEILFKKIENDN